MEIFRFIPILENKVAFQRVKATQLNDSKLGCIGLILPNLESLNFDSFHAAQMQLYFRGLV